jgi:hypothetical protein
MEADWLLPYRTTLRYHKSIHGVWVHMFLGRGHLYRVLKWRHRSVLGQKGTNVIFFSSRTFLRPVQARAIVANVHKVAHSLLPVMYVCTNTYDFETRTMHLVLKCKRHKIAMLRKKKR